MRGWTGTNTHRVADHGLRIAALITQPAARASVSATPVGRLASALTLAALLAACSGGADRAAAPSGTSAGRPATTNSTPRSTTSATAEAKAEAIVLRLPDFPAGWQQVPDEASREDDQFDKKLKACIGLPKEAKAPSAKAVFSKGDALQVSSQVEIVGSRDVAERYFDALSGPKLNGCLERVFDEIFSKETGGAASVHTRVQKLDLPSLGKRSLARRITLRARGNGKSAMVAIDLLLGVKERAEMSLGFVSVGHPFPRDLAVRLARTMAGRA